MRKGKKKIANSCESMLIHKAQHNSYSYCWPNIIYFNPFFEGALFLKVSLSSTAETLSKIAIRSLFQLYKPSNLTEVFRVESKLLICL